MINLDIKDIKFKTLAGLPFKYENINIYAPTIKEIAEMGESTYNKCLALLQLRKEDLISPEYIHIFENNTTLDIILGVESESFNEYKEVTLTFFKFFLQVKNHEFDECLIINDTQITQKVLDDIKYIVNVQNLHETKENKQPEYNIQSEKSKAFYEKLLKQRQKVAELKRKAAEENGTDLSLYDLTSILSTAVEGINLFNVFELNLMQFNVQYSRMQNREQYDISIRSLLAGADPKNVKVENWMKKSDV